jgi:hypothetical protein
MERIDRAVMVPSSPVEPETITCSPGSSASTVTLVYFWMRVVSVVMTCTVLPSCVVTVDGLDGVKRATGKAPATGLLTAGLNRAPDSGELAAPDCEPGPTVAALRQVLHRILDHLVLSELHAPVEGTPGHRRQDDDTDQYKHGSLHGSLLAIRYSALESRSGT